MQKRFAETLLSAHKNFVFIGEAGSGKTETSLNIAMLFAAQSKRKVHFFDMDQTKPLFRARNAAAALEAAGVEVHYQEQYMDAPVVAPGVVERLLDEDAVVLLDIGGGAYGSHMIGQFSHVLQRAETRVFYIVNPYRPWSGTGDNVAETMSRTVGAARLGGIDLVANPNTGPNTTLEEALEGMRRVRALFPERKIHFVCALDHLAPALQARLDEFVLPIELVTYPDWL